MNGITLMLLLFLITLMSNSQLSTKVDNRHFVLYLSLVCETDLQPFTSPTSLPLAGKCYFSAPPYACHLVPPTSDGERCGLAL